MRITHVYKDSYPPVFGGNEQHIHALVHELKCRASSEVLVSGDRAGREEDQGIPIHRVGSWARVQGAPFSPTLPYWLARNRADVYHFHMPNPTGELSYLIAGRRRPAVATYHSDIVRQARALRLYRPFLDAFLRRAERIIVATPYHVSSSPVLPAYREKCRIIPYGIDTARFAPSPATLARAESLRERLGERLVLFVGKFRYYKGVDYLLRAMAQVEGRLLLVGEGPEEPRLRALAMKLGIEERIIWFAHVEEEELVAALHACDVFVLPSIHTSEAFGIAQLEAQACGKPVVCTALGTGVEFVNLNERTGLFVPPRNVDALATAVRRLLDDREYRMQLGETARARVQAEFTLQGMASRILEVYQSVGVME